MFYITLDSRIKIEKKNWGGEPTHINHKNVTSKKLGHLKDEEDTRRIFLLLFLKERLKKYEKNLRYFVFPEEKLHLFLLLRRFDGKHGQASHELLGK